MSTPQPGTPADAPKPEPTPEPTPAPDRRALISDAAIALVAAGGLRSLTHRAVDGAAGLPAGSTSYYFRTRAALVGACYRRLAELDLADFEEDARTPGPWDRDTAARALGALLHRWLTAGRERQLARFELSLEAARTPEAAPELLRAGLAVRARAAGLLGALGADRPDERAALLAAWTDGLLYDRLAGALAGTRPAPDPAELASTARLMIDAALAGP